MRFVSVPWSYTAVNKRLRVEVAYATPERQEITTLLVEEGCNIQQAVESSGILQRFPEIDLAHQRVGIFSKKRELTDLLADGDRIEIYRPLTIDPKEARRTKAKMKAVKRKN
jgi:putative ubiquitin-RnfH superfamily antitoxin RatB of RatAB toxin-antitoxin module